MTDHDPMCKAPQYWHSPGTAMATCQCNLIAEVRADERDTATSVAAEMMNEAWTNLRAQIEVLGPPQSSWDSPNAAEGWLDAIQAVLALFDRSSDGDA